MFLITDDTTGFMRALVLILFILIGVVFTFIVSKILSKTILKGVPSSFTLELPPYRRPQIGKVLVRSLLDRTLFVLGRAISVAAPAGLVIWLFAIAIIGAVCLYEVSFMKLASYYSEIPPLSRGKSKKRPGPEDRPRMAGVWLAAPGGSPVVPVFGVHPGQDGGQVAELL